MAIPTFYTAFLCKEWCDSIRIDRLLFSFVSESTYPCIYVIASKENKKSVNVMLDKFIKLGIIMNSQWL